MRILENKEDIMQYIEMTVEEAKKDVRKMQKF